MNEEKSITKIPTNELQTISSSLINRGLSLVDKKEKTILISDDEPSLVALYKKLLQEHLGVKYNLRIVYGDRKKALDLVRSETSIDLVITDRNSPGMNGIEMARIIRKEKPSVKILFVTAQTSDNKYAKLLQEHVMDVYLPKPFEAEELIRVVENLLNKKAEEEELRNKILRMVDIIEETGKTKIEDKEKKSAAELFLDVLEVRLDLERSIAELRPETSKTDPNNTEDENNNS